MTPHIEARHPSLRGKTVLVTGGASGIGRCFAEAFVGQGAHVVCIDINAAALSDLASAVPEGMVDTHICDLTDRSALNTLLDRILIRPIDVLVNNAAEDNRHDWDAIDTDGWDRCLAVNLDHLFFCAQAVARNMMPRKRGVILNMGSASWQRGRPAMVGYLTAKSALHGMTKGLARELGPHGIRVLGIMPGAIETERQNRLWRTQDGLAKMLAEQAMPIALDGWDVANLALFLASDAARGCTGHFYPIDAGLT
jgi:NAD(P)-dependent dehydrogenase (short-subunit alcohol dehydrogenase family)